LKDEADLLIANTGELAAGQMSDVAPVEQILAARRAIETAKQMTDARACSTCASKSDGSSSAMTCPRRTRELKSACRDLIVPDTCVPTCTVVTA